MQCINKLYLSSFTHDFRKKWCFICIWCTFPMSSTKMKLVQLAGELITSQLYIAVLLLTVNNLRNSCSGRKTNASLARDLIAATGLIILLKLDSNRRFVSPCDFEIWWMTLKDNRAPFLCYIKLCASFQIRQWIHTGVTVRKRLICVKFDEFLSRVTLKFDGWPS